MRATRFLALASIVAILALGAFAQGYQTPFPSPGGSSETVPPPTYGTASPAPNATPAPAYKTPSYNTPSYNTPSYNTPSYNTPSHGTPTPSPNISPVTPGQVPGPTPTYGSVVQPPPTGWDPYAPVGSNPPATILPQDYYPTPPTLPETAKLQRLIDEIRLDYYLLAPRGSKKFGTNDLELSTTVALPFFYNQETPLLITPGFAFHWWEGPTGPATDPVPGNVLPFLPPRVYDAYLGAAWNPQITPTVGGELEFRVGVYSDFGKLTSKSLRYTGQGLFVLSVSESFKAKLGIVYYDRIRIKMLPAGGIVWKPNSDTEFSLIFPYPRISRRLSNYGVTEWWLYCRGEYGGGSWTVDPEYPEKYPKDQEVTSPVQVDYNDLRFAIGLEFDRMDRIGGLIEVGTSFDRELISRNPRYKFSPSTTIFLRAGLTR